MYAAVAKTNPLTSRLSQQFYKITNQLIDTVDNTEELKTVFEAINNFFQKTESMGSYNAGVKKSIETDSDNLINTVSKLAKVMSPKEIVDTIRNFPLVGQYVANGMRWRGWKVDENGLHIPENEKELSLNSNNNSNFS